MINYKNKTMIALMHKLNLYSKTKNIQSWIQFSIEDYGSKVHCRICGELIGMFKTSSISSAHKVDNNIHNHAIKHLEEHNLLPFI